MAMAPLTHARRTLILVLGSLLLTALALGLSVSFTSAQTADGAFDDFNQPVMSPRQMLCKQLEQRYAREQQQGQQARSGLPQIDAGIAKYDRAFQQGQVQAERQDCFDYFLFSREWRTTPRCVRLRQQIEGARRALEGLQQQREQIENGQVIKTRQDALINELARNRCGPQYQQEAQRRTGQSTFFWDDNAGAPNLEPPLASGGGGGGTYRTLCVRTCDGYYFPISFATTHSSFQRDAEMCQAQCAAPARLFIYQNPGAEIEQAVSVDGTTPYSRLSNAFRYRHELVKGCSCKQAEYAADLLPESSRAPQTAAAVAPTLQAAGEPGFVPAAGPGDQVAIEAAPVVKRRKPKVEAVRPVPRYLQ
jgi:Protein of unknown function (DUF2865)